MWILPGVIKSQSPIALVFVIRCFKFSVKTYCQVLPQKLPYVRYVPTYADVQTTWSRIHAECLALRWPVGFGLFGNDHHLIRIPASLRLLQVQHLVGQLADQLFIRVIRVGVETSHFQGMSFTDFVTLEVTNLIVISCICQGGNMSCWLCWPQVWPLGFCLDIHSWKQNSPKNPIHHRLRMWGHWLSAHQRTGLSGAAKT